MSDQHVSVQMDGLTERRRDRSNSKDKYSSESPGSQRRFARAVSEADDPDERPDILDPAPGVDDGLLPPEDKHDKHNSKIPNGGITPTTDENGLIPKRRPSYSIFDHDEPRTIMIDGIETPVPDVNAYQHKKTLAQGMMDLALLSANANQLRYVIESYNRHPYFYASFIFISLSIIFQVAVGVGLILNSQYNIKDKREICKANRISNLTIIGIFIITVVNVFISAFGVANAPDSP